MNKVITLAGPSGSGKSTLAKILAHDLKLDYFEGSAGLTLSNREELMEKYGWKGSGHKEVIKLSNENPEFGIAFQFSLLSDRATKLLRLQRDTVTDRSLVDNLVYFLLQNTHNLSDADCTSFINKVQYYIKKSTTHLIYVPTLNPMDIENNGSRISNIHYQRMVSAVFRHAIQNYIIPMGVKVYTIENWDLDLRVKEAKNFING